MRLPSIADELRVAQRDEVARLPVDARVRLALQLGSESIALFASAHGLSVSEARRMIERERQAGRRRSGCLEALLA